MIMNCKYKPFLFDTATSNRKLINACVLLTLIKNTES